MELKHPLSTLLNVFDELKIRPFVVFLNFLWSQIWSNFKLVEPGNTKGGHITVPLTSCLTGLESAVWQLNFLFKFAKQTNPIQEVNWTVYSAFSIPWSNPSELCSDHFPSWQRQSGWSQKNATMPRWSWNTPLVPYYMCSTNSKFGCL